MHFCLSNKCSYLLQNLEKFDSFQNAVILPSIECITDTLIDVVLVKIQYFLLNVDCYIF